MQPGSDKKPIQIIIITTYTHDSIEIFLRGPCVFEKCTRYHFFPFIRIQVNILIITVIDHTQTGPEFMNSAFNDRLVNKICVQIILIAIVLLKPKIRTVVMPESRKL